MYYSWINTTTSKIISAFVLCTIFVNNCWAFTEKTAVKDSIRKSKLYFYSDLSTLSSIDELYSSEIFSGRNIGYGLKYTFSKNKVNHVFKLDYYKIERYLKPYPDFKNYYYDRRYYDFVSQLIEFDYTFMYQSKIKIPQIFDVYFTGSLINYLNLIQEKDPELISCNVSPGFFINTNGVRHQFNLKVSIPILSLVIRNNYATQQAQDYETYHFSLMENMKIQSLKTLFMVFMDIGYEIHLKYNITINTQYSFVYIHNSNPRPLHLVNGEYFIGLAYSF